jgi:hypothetical protein
MKSPRCLLSIGQAREIYGLKLLASTSASVQDAQGQPEEISYCTLLAAKYGVSSKTIRDHGIERPECLPKTTFSVRNK